MKFPLSSLLAAALGCYLSLPPLAYATAHSDGLTPSTDVDLVSSSVAAQPDNAATATIVDTPALPSLGKGTPQANYAGNTPDLSPQIETPAIPATLGRPIPSYTGSVPAEVAAAQSKVAAAPANTTNTKNVATATATGALSSMTTSSAAPVTKTTAAPTPFVYKRQPTPSADEKLIFQDEFTSGEREYKPINNKYWSHSVDGNGNGINELQFYTDFTENAYVANNSLHLVVRKKAMAKKEYTSAKIKTHGKVYFKYGRVEARIKLPNAHGKTGGLFPGLWMLPEEHTDCNSWPGMGAIDIMQFNGGSGNVYHNAFFGQHGAGNYKQKPNLSKDVSKWSETDAEGFHQYTLIKEPGVLTWYMNGNQVGTLTKEYVEKLKCNDQVCQWPYEDHDYHLILNFAVGGDVAGPVDPEIQFPQYLDVDYIRVFSKPSYAPTGASTAAIPSSPATAIASPQLPSYPASASVSSATTPAAVKPAAGSNSASNPMKTGGTPSPAMPNGVPATKPASNSALGSPAAVVPALGALPSTTTASSTSTSSNYQAPKPASGALPSTTTGVTTRTDLNPSPASGGAPSTTTTSTTLTTSTYPNPTPAAGKQDMTSTSSTGAAYPNMGASSMNSAVEAEGY